jgi:hypothetical protein
MSQLEILGNDGKPVLYVSLQHGNLRLEFEYQGNATGEADLEVIYSIKPDTVAVIKAKFGCAPYMEIMHEHLKFSKVAYYHWSRVTSSLLLFSD